MGRSVQARISFLNAIGRSRSEEERSGKPLDGEGMRVEGLL